LQQFKNSLIINFEILLILALENRKIFPKTTKLQFVFYWNRKIFPKTTKLQFVFYYLSDRSNVSYAIMINVHSYPVRYVLTCILPEREGPFGKVVGESRELCPISWTVLIVKPLLSVIRQTITLYH